MRVEKLFPQISALVFCILLFTAAQSSAASEYKVLHAFKGGTDGVSPFADLTRDSLGNLYGTTVLGGDVNLCSGGGCGVIFRLHPNPDGSWSKKNLYVFTGGADGAGPQAKLTLDSAGNLYGTTAYGGLFGPKCSLGCGVVFKLTRNPNGTWTQSVLYSFTGLTDGAIPLSKVDL